MNDLHTMAVCSKTLVILSRTVHANDYRQCLPFITHLSSLWRLLEVVDIGAGVAATNLGIGPEYLDRSR
jgi:hypothetical protein